MIYKYLITAGDMNYGLSPKDARVLAYQCAAGFNVKFLHQWSAKSIAGEDWLSGFILRNPILSLQMLDVFYPGRGWWQNLEDSI